MTIDVSPIPIAADATTVARGRWPRLVRWAGRAGWVLLALEGVLWYTLGSVDADQPLLLLAIGALLILGTWAGAFLLCVRYRRLLETYYALAGFVGLLALATWTRHLATDTAFAGLPIMGFLALLVALPASIALVLRRRDVSAELIGLVLLAFVWVSLVASVPYGGPIRVWILYASGSGAAQFWWFESLTCLLMMVLPIGSLAFLAHLLRFAVKEIRG